MTWVFLDKNIELYEEICCISEDGKMMTRFENIIGNFKVMRLKHILSILALFVVVLSSALFRIELPGVFADSSNPDYYFNAVFRNMYSNPRWGIPQVGIPLISQVYRGVFHFLVGIPLYAVLGTNLYTLRLLNAGYCFVALIFLYGIIYKSTMNYKLSFLITLLLSTNVLLIASTVTMVYAFLPGSALLLASIYVLLKNDPPLRRNLMLSGFLLGMSFYTYFIFLFFLPGFVFAIYLKMKVSKPKYALLLWFYSFCLGAVLYVIGYASLFIALLPIEYSLQIFYLWFFVFVLAVSLLPPYFVAWFSVKIGIKIKCIYGIFVTLCLLAFVFAKFVGDFLINAQFSNYINVLRTQINNLDVLGYEISAVERLMKPIIFTVNMFSNNINEHLILQQTTSAFANIYFYIIIVTVVIALTLSHLANRKKSENYIDRHLRIIVSLVASFYVCSLVFVSRMHYSHFIPLIFLGMILMGLSIHSIQSSIQQSESKSLRLNALNYVLTVTMSLLLMLNIHNQVSFYSMLSTTGGRGKFTEEINTLAITALHFRNQNIEEIYIFPEWGFMQNFSFLTSGEVRIEDANGFTGETLLYALLNNKRVIVGFWDETNAEVYLDVLKSVYTHCHIELNTWYKRDNSVGFYTLTAHPMGIHNWRQWPHDVLVTHKGFSPQWPAIWLELPYESSEALFVYIKTTQRLVDPIRSGSVISFSLWEDELTHNFAFYVVDLTNQTLQHIDTLEVERTHNEYQGAQPSS